MTAARTNETQTHAAPSSIYRILAAATAVLTACQPAAPTPPAPTNAPHTRASSTVFRITGPHDVITLDPAYATSELDAWITGDFLFDQLFTFDAAGALTPELAAAPPAVHPDQRTFTVTLRSDVVFHNGRTITADDVLFSIERLRSAGTGIASGDTIDNITAMQTPDERTIVFQLAEPQANFPAHLTNPWFSIMPRRETLVAGAAFGTRTVVGSGKYRLDAWDAGRRLRLIKRTASSFPAVIEFTLNAAAPVALEQFRNGEAEFAWFNPNAVELSDARSDPALTSAWRAAAGTTAAVLWLNPRSPRQHDAARRRRIVQSLDPADISTVLPDTHPISSLPMFSPAPSATLSMPMDAAASNSANSEPGDIDPADEFTLTGAVSAAAVEALAASLRDAGLRVRIVHGTPADLAAQVEAGRIDFVFAPRKFDPNDATTLFTTGGRCDADALLTICSPEIRDLIDQAQSMNFDDPTRQQLLRRAHDILIADEFRIVPVFVYDTPILCSASADACDIDARYGFPNITERK